MTLSDDGQTVLYTPPAGFSGTDSFAYYLDNDSRGEVLVEVTRTWNACCLDSATRPSWRST